MNDPRTEMDRALEKAIEVSRRQKRYSVSDGRLRDEQPGRYRYTFLLEYTWDLTDDTDLELESSELAQPLQAKLSSTKDEVVTITVGQRLPVSALDHAYLVVDRARLLRKMQEALNQESAPAQLGLKLFGALDSVDGEADDHLLEQISDVFQPDEAQRRAIKRAMESELLMILGPPGTGKTDVLAAIALLHSILYKPTRVLITSHTNIAIDNAIIRLARFFRQHGLDHLLENHHLVRYGDPHLADLMSNDYRSIAMPLIIEDEIEPLREEIARLERKREQLHGELAKGRSELPKLRAAWQERKVALVQQQKKIRSELADLEAEEQARLASIDMYLLPLLRQDEAAKQILESSGTSWNSDHRTFTSLQTDYQQKLALYQVEEAKLQRLRTHPPIVRFFVQLARSEWENDVEARVRVRGQPLTLLMQQIEPLRVRLDENFKRYQQAEQRRKDLAPAVASWKKRREIPQQYTQKKVEHTKSLQQIEQELVTGNPRIVGIEQEIENWAKQVVLLEEALARLDQQVIDVKHKAARMIVENASIVGATLTALYLNPTLLSQEWDVVIVDEGSMAPPPAVMIAADRARHHLVVVGDPLQLAPVCKLKDPDGQDLIKHWLGRDVFSHGGYTLQEAGAGTHHSILLPYQSRMHADICDLVRGPIYKGLLKDRNPHAPRPKIGPEPEHAVVLYDTGPSRQARALKPASGSSRYNPYHAEIVKHMAEQVLPDMPNVAPECIGIVTPYAAQRDCIKELLRGTELEVFTRVGTVHAFQGLEFDALILDIVESPGLKIAPFLRGGWGSDAMRLLNVAVTRARHKLLIVVNMPYISGEPASFILPQIMRLACQKKRIPVDDAWGK